MPDVLRTPDQRFNDLPDFPYRPNYLDNLKGCNHFMALRALFQRAINYQISANRLPVANKIRTICRFNYLTN